MGKEREREGGREERQGRVEKKRKKEERTRAHSFLLNIPFTSSGKRLCQSIRGPVAPTPSQQFLLSFFSLAPGSICLHM